MSLNQLFNSIHFIHFYSEIILEFIFIYLFIQDSFLQIKDLFIELEQLTVVNETSDNRFEWNEVSRWIKYEQNLTLDSNVWSKPFVGALIYQSLLYLKTGLQYGQYSFFILLKSLNFNNKHNYRHCIT